MNEQTTRTIEPMEQLACNLVMRADGYRRGLVEWAHRVATDPSCTEWLDQATATLVEHDADYAEDDGVAPGELAVRGLGATLVQYVADLNNAWAQEALRLEDKIADGSN